MASALGVPFRALGAFAAMTPADEAEVVAAMRAADAVVVVATPFGPANLGNLRAAVSCGRPAVLVGDLDALQDFSRGEALALWERLRRAHAVECADAGRVGECVQAAMRAAADAADDRGARG